MTELLPADSEGIARAAALIRAGQPVAVPTETVYGLAADATSPEAVARIYAAKGRPSFNPLIVHVAESAAAEAIAVMPRAARALAEACWPGPLTMVLERRPEAPIAALATAGLPTVAIRVPAHPVMQAVLAAVDRPLAAPSANASGGISPTRAKHVRRSLDGRIPLVLDGGPARHGLESTILLCAFGAWEVLRPGPILIDDTRLPDASRVRGITAPGQLPSHYAPAQPVRLEAAAAEAGEWLIGFGPVRGDATLSAGGDLVEAAANLFERLHEAECAGRARIAVAPVPDEGLGRAINDRLRRCAAPR